MVYNVLWTGGWDSTFRILDLVLNKKGTVQPYYVLDTARKSTKMEIKTMEKIKEMIISKDFDASYRIKQTIEININNIPINDEITEQYKSLASMSHLGGQYDWLARFASDKGLDDLELCIHRDDKAFDFIKNDVIKVDDGFDGYYKLQENFSIESLNIFSYFHYPILDISKIDMEKMANKSGFEDIMEVTWFCHKPIRNKPCGMCNPCKYTKEEGLGRRVPDPTKIDEMVFKFNRIKNRVSRKLKSN